MNKPFDQAFLDDTEDYYQFLVDKYGFELVRKKRSSVTLMMAYIHKKLDLKICLDHDMREKFLYFSLIKGINTKEHSDVDHTHIKTFVDLFTSLDPTINPNKLQPKMEENTRIAIKKNAEYLERFGDKLFK